MEKKMKFEFTTSISNIEELNPSFDKGVIRVAYHGLNRNLSVISKETFQRALPTLMNCPVVGHYMRDKTDEDGNKGDFGGHDYHIEVNGNDMQYVVDTYPIGLVNESAKQWWEIIQEEDGQVHEYLNTECLLWKRQDGYNKIKDSGRLNQSMEIGVKDGEFDNQGNYVIKDFYFEALTILSNSVEPCFENSSITMFSFNKDKFKQEYDQMISDLKKYSLEEKEEKLMEEKLEEVVESVEVVEEVVEPVEETTEFTTDKTEEVVEEPSVFNEKDTELFDLKKQLQSKDEQIFSLNSELITLKDNYSKLEGEVAELREFKMNTESAKSLADKEVVFEEYSIGLTEEEMQDVREKINEYSLEDIKSKLNEKFTAKTLAELKSRKKDEKPQDTFTVAINHKDSAKSKYAV